MIGMRIRIRFGNPDPGYPVFIEAPTDPVAGTVIKQYTGIHDRTCYYVRLDSSLELTITDPAPPFGQGRVRILPQKTSKETNMGVVRVSEVVSLCDDSFYRLGREIVASGRGTASYACLIFSRTLPKAFSLQRAQDDAKKPLTHKDRADLGYADIEVLEKG
jgi:hypothetical protein